MYKLETPYTEQEKTDFIFKYNQDCFGEGYHCRIEEGTSKSLYALEDYEILEGDEVVIDTKWEEKQAQKRENEFKIDFFLTSLGWIRRKVSMKTGETKDFLTDLLPVISMAVSQGQAVNIITYREPDSWLQDVTDWEELQTVKTATPQFIQECFNQVSTDFTGL